MKVSENPIVIQQSFPVPAETVWHAISDARQMREWYFEQIPAFEPVVGFHTEFDVQSGERHFRHIWTVTEAVSLNRLCYRWHYAEYPGDSVVCFELHAHGGQITLTLTHTVLQDFPEDIPEFKRESGVAGWTYFITESLKTYLENQA